MSVKVEVFETKTDAALGPGEKTVRKVVDLGKDQLEEIRRAIDLVEKGVLGCISKASKLEVEFGIVLEAGVDAAIVSKVQGTFNIRVSWDFGEAKSRDVPSPQEFEPRTPTQQVRQEDLSA
ncbi:MAG: hypothetical protein ACLQU5_27135 [Isosphaeraceae bacterium]